MSADRPSLEDLRELLASRSKDAEGDIWELTEWTLLSVLCSSSVDRHTLSSSMLVTAFGFSEKRLGDSREKPSPVSCSAALSSFSRLSSSRLCEGTLGSSANVKEKHEYSFSIF